MARRSSRGHKLCTCPCRRQYRHWMTSLYRRSCAGVDKPSSAAFTESTCVACRNGASIVQKCTTSIVGCTWRSRRPETYARNSAIVSYSGVNASATTDCSTPFADWFTGRRSTGCPMLPFAALSTAARVDSTADPSTITRWRSWMWRISVSDKGSRRVASIGNGGMPQACPSTWMAKSKRTNAAGEPSSVRMSLTMFRVRILNSPSAKSWFAVAGFGSDVGSGTGGPGMRPETIIDVAGSR
mmetsp:Transcript_39200/g.121147  ORF Transcript_39200/g.121147 Transcript_39200/m.121147 type:complete len:241 (-) Transcript_39200:473-1195(-)